MADTTIDTGVPGATSPAKSTFVANAAARSYSGPSIVDYLSYAGSPNDFGSRTTMANQYGIQNYTGTADQNTSLLSMLRGGQGAGTSAAASPAGAPSPAPATGSSSSSIEDAYKTAFDTYLQSLAPSAEQNSARDYLNKLISQNASDNDKALNSGETLGYSRALAARVNNSERNDISAASRALTALNGDQTSRTGIAKAKADYMKGIYDTNAKTEQAKITAGAKDNAPFNLSPGQSRYTYNDKTGAYEKVASVAPRPAAGSKATTADKTASAYSQIDALMQPGVRDSNGVPYLAPDGSLTWQGYKTLLAAASESKITKTNFLKQIGSSLQPGVNNDYAGYGLTPADIRILTGPKPAASTVQ